MQKAVIVNEPEQTAASGGVLDGAVLQILETAASHFKLENAALFLVEGRTATLRLVAYIGSAEQAKARILPLASGIAGAAASAKQVTYAPDVKHDPRYVQAVAGTRSELAVPLLVNDEAIAILDCRSDRANAFEGGMEQLQLFCRTAALALHNAQLYSREQRRRSQVEAVNAVARETTSVFEINQLLDRLCNVILANFGADQVSIVLYEQGHLTVSRSCGSLTASMPEGQQLPESASLCSRALGTGAPVLENNVRATAAYIPGYDETRSEVCLPLISFSEPLGALVLDSAEENAFDPEEVHAMQAVADVCATAIQNARHFERARNLANVDGLTGIYNRRYFEQRILEELERSVRYNGSMALLMIDIDHFKKLNDEFGHLLGDEVLRQVSNIFTQNLRKNDVVCRYGGEEFAILVPETPGTRATAVADKLRRIIETWNFPGVPRPVTISVGVAEFPTDGRSRDELMKAADDALYLAKQRGRNRVVAAQPKAVTDFLPTFGEPAKA